MTCYTAIILFVFAAQQRSSVFDWHGPKQCGGKYLKAAASLYGGHSSLPIF
ncbi:MAG: hypothetical protein ACI9BO_000334 [Zhongshania sp.]|jgi:hypothetical protein